MSIRESTDAPPQERDLSTSRVVLDENKRRQTTEQTSNKMAGGIYLFSAFSRTKYGWKSTFRSFLMITSCVLILKSSAAVTAAANVEEETKTITCATGWGSNGEQLIVSEQINDGYCDCPIDGKDEPDTQACSGSDTWPGGSPSSSVGVPDEEESRYVVVFVSLWLRLVFVLSSKSPSTFLQQKQTKV